MACSPPWKNWPSITPLQRFGAKVASVKSLVRICFVAGVFASCLPAYSETLRCNGHIVETGDSRLSVRYQCGEPLLQDSYCAPVYYAPGFQRVPEPFASAVVPCLVVDEWLYDRGPGNLAATVCFRTGVVLSITYGPRATPP
jgi:hypothetical protein